MPTCDKQVGVRNISITFKDCDSDREYPPISHQLSGDTQPTYILCPYDNEALMGGFVRRSQSNSEIALSVIRNPGIPLALYQGCGSVDLTIEHYNGRVITGVNGSATGREASDGHEVAMTLTFTAVDELLSETATTT